MNGWIVLGVIVGLAILAVVANRLGWIDLSNKSRSGGGSGGVMGIGDEVFNPRRYEAQIELDRQTTLPAPAPLAGDRPTDSGPAHLSDEPGQYRGRMHIDLGKDRRRP
ncbi:MAG TPA: hypothetical protein VIJ76_07875 [Galbitalea sp.]